MFKRFSHWQEGYAAFTCSQRDIDDLIEYLQGQEEPHRKTAFEEQYRNLLVEAGIEFDERYMLSAHCPAPFGAVTIFLLIRFRRFHLRLLTVLPFGQLDKGDKAI